MIIPTYSSKSKKQPYVYSTIMDNKQINGIIKFDLLRFLSPLAAVPIVTFAGLGLFNFGFPIVEKFVEIGLPALLLFVVLSQIWDLQGTLWTILGYDEFT